MSASYLPPRPPVQLPKPSLVQTIPDLFESFPDKAALFNRILQEYSGLSADPLDPVRIVLLYQLLAAANELTPGDYIELGTYGGLTLKVIHRLMDPQRTLYALDTFEGFDARDIAIEKTKYDYTSGLEWFSRPSIENVAKYVGDGEAPTNLKLVKGWFPESFKGLEEIRWRFVHIDMDLYQPVKAALQMLWASVVPGGIVVVHDYGCYSFRAARIAVDEFCDSIGIPPVEMPDRWGSAVLRKPFAGEHANQTHGEELKKLRLEIIRVHEEEAEKRARSLADADEVRRKQIVRERDDAATALHRAVDEANETWRKALARVREEEAEKRTGALADAGEVWRKQFVRQREDAATALHRALEEAHETWQQTRLNARARRLLARLQRGMGLRSAVVHSSRTAAAKAYLETEPDVAKPSADPSCPQIASELRKGSGEPPSENILFAEEHRETLAPYFDAAFYRKSNPDIPAACDPYRHFMLVGWKEGRNPSATFDVRYYLDTYEDVIKSALNPLYHFALSGAREGRAPSAAAWAEQHRQILASYFDADYYRRSNPDLPADCDPYQHFMLVGWKERRNPSAAFDVGYYLRANPDVRKSDLNPLYHFALSGAREGRKPLPTQDELLRDSIRCGLDVNRYCDEIRAVSRKGNVSAALQMIVDLVRNILVHERSVGRVFSSKQLDELCLELGSATEISRPSAFDAEQSVFLVTAVHKTGGHSRVLKDLIKTDPGTKKVVLVTNVTDGHDASKPHLEESEFQEWMTEDIVEYRISPPTNLFDRLRWLQTQLSALRPARTYILQHHFDPVAVAACQPGLSEKFLCLHNCDHMLTLGVHNPSVIHIDFNAKSFYNCRDREGITNNVVWPLTSLNVFEGPAESFFFRDRLTTATCGGFEKFHRSHQLDPISYRFPYEEMVPTILQATNGLHIHIGKLIPEMEARISAAMSSAGIPLSRFMNIPFVPNLAKALRELKVDVYVASFPLGGGRASVEAMAAGLPIIVHSNYRSIFFTDENEVYPEAMIWRSPAELRSHLGSLTEANLQRHAASSFDFFVRHHRPECLVDTVSRTLANQEVPIPSRPHYAPDALQTFLDELAIAPRETELRERGHAAAARHRALDESK